jgi:hypothetical protein
MNPDFTSADVDPIETFLNWLSILAEPVNPLQTLLNTLGAFKFVAGILISVKTFFHSIFSYPRMSSFPGCDRL